MQQAELLLREMFATAVRSVHPSVCLPASLPAPPLGKTVIVGAGKAAAAMAKAVEEAWSGELSGTVVTRYGHSVPCSRIEVLEAGHPVPDENGLKASHAILGRLEGLTENDLVICLISGGGSSLLTSPAPGISLGDKQRVSRELLRSGASISEINCVRKHLSAIKGGRLARAAFPARVVTLAISDIPGDNVGDIASGPTCADPTTRLDALDVIRRYGVAETGAIGRWLDSPKSETPKVGASELSRVDNRIIATAQDALEAAAAHARKAGLTPLILGNSIEGEARHVAAVHVGIAKQVLAYGQPVARGCVLLSGGETTVTVRGSGRGGRNAEFLTAFASMVCPTDGFFALAADTDGIDGSESNAGVLLTPDKLAQAQLLGLNPADYLQNNDGFGFFEAIDGLVDTGPTMTNVNDFRAIIIL